MAETTMPHDPRNESARQRWILHAMLMLDDDTYIYRDPIPSRARRKIPKSSQGHFVGEFVFDRNGVSQVVGFESLLEYKAGLCAVYQPGFFDLEEQIDPVFYRNLKGRIVPHWFDFRMTMTGGLRIAMAVKPRKIAITAKFRAKMQLIADAAVPTVADRVCIVTEQNICPVEFHNAKLFHAARTTEASIDEHISANIQKLRIPTPINAFLDQIGLRGDGFHSIARHIRSKALAAEDGEKITGATHIRVAEAA
ncbi:hypothetical protein KBW81_03045 [Loktanella salsilacus]|uniref:hypothetical protein n=1 Tax=Loktanella salsilacus TaxID=195913 RepID=UPI0020B821E2|nr:hypothetical protein [Loktanella salsilacus]UTH48802.1 hypothetical protein KBW81_03045 [Loktanella salsilacus]